jgi:hypothetical protein
VNFLLDLVNAIGGYGWLLSLVVLLWFVVTRGWRMLCRWQQFYIILMCLLLPFLLYASIALGIAGEALSDAGYVGIIVGGGWYLIEWIGIAAGLSALNKMGSPSVPLSRRKRG